MLSAFSNILDHPKTSIAGVLIGVVTVAGVLSQQGITLGRAGTGTVVALIGALATAMLGLFAKDPAASDSIPLSGKVGVILLAVMLCGSPFLTGCTSSQIDQAVTIVETNLPTVIADAVQIATVIGPLMGASQSGPDALTVLKNKADDVNAVLQGFKAGANTWQDVSNAVDALVNAADAAEDLSGIKDPATRAKAQALLASVDVVVHIIDGAVQTTLPPSVVKAKAAARAVKLSLATENWNESDKRAVADALAPMTRGRSWQELYSAEIAAGF